MPEEVEKSDEQEAAEDEVESFKQHLGPFVVAAETTRMPMVFTNAEEPDNPIVFANDSFLALTKYERAEVLGQSFNSLMERGAAPEALAQVKEAFAGDVKNDPEICYRRKDGSDFWASLFISPVRDENARVVQHFISFVNLTRHVEEQAHAKMLIDELNHRVKNTLATVNSIVSQALRNSSDVAEVGGSIEGRLSALSRSHDLLTRESWKSAGVLDVLRDALQPFGVADGRAERFVITGENRRLPPKAVLALGIAFHELATNAVKYGAFSNEAGCIRISSAIAPGPNGDRLLLHWREQGGPPVTPPTRKGFGSRVIERGLAYELGGKVNLEYQPDGVVCTIEIPDRRALPMMDRLLSGQRVLVVEDEFLVLMHMEDMLADLGCDAVTSAATVNDALALIDAKTFDLCMLDMNLDGHRTDAVADALAEHGVPFAFATGYSFPDMSDEHRDRPVLNKPILNGKLVETLTGLLPH